MPLRNKVPILLATALGLSACGMLGGRDDAPTIALPAGAALAPYEPLAPPPSRREVSAEEVQSPAPIMPVSSGQGAPPEAMQGNGPRGTSGEVRGDTVGYAAPMNDPPDQAWSNVVVGVAHPSLPAGTLVELTALDTGRTILALVVGRESSGAVVSLSPGAAQALGVNDRAAVRVRTVVASPQDQLALRSGQAVSARLDAPPALLIALRRKLPGQRASAPVRAVPPRVATRPVLAPSPVAAPGRANRSGFMVQVAAVSSAARAQALAQELGGHVAAGGGIYRVQIGPFADMASAQRARDGAARRGYGDSRIFHTE